jgi:hypothetical protein
MGAAAFGMARAQDGVLSMPFELSDYGSPVISVTIRGAGPYKFILSTASTTGSIREDLAQSLGLTKVSSRPVLRDGERVMLGLYTAPEVMIGGIFKQSSVAFMGLKRAFRFDGILPANIVTGLISELDFDAQLIRYYPGGFVELPGYVRVPSFQRTEGGTNCVFVESLWQGEKVNLILDSYSSSEVMFDAGTVKKLKLWDKYKDAVPDQSGNSEFIEKRDIRKIKDQSFSFGDLSLNGVTLSLWDPKIQDSRQGGGSLGIKALRRHNILFGGLKGLYFKPNQFTAPA